MKIPIKNYTTDGKGVSLTGGLEIMKAVNKFETNKRMTKGHDIPKGHDVNE